MGEFYEVNGNKVWIKPTKSRFERNIIEIESDIYTALGSVGIEPKYIRIMNKGYKSDLDVPAIVVWEVNGEEHKYETDVQGSYKDNLGVISKVIKYEAYAIKNGLKTFTQVMNQFRLGYNPEGEAVKSPRDILGVAADNKDLSYISFKYKKLAKELHPDVGGDQEKFKELKKAYDDLKEELSK